MTWDEKIKDFETFLKFERNFSDNTLDAYLRDIKKLKDYAEFDLENTGPLEITYENIQEYLFQLSKKKFSERTQARWVSSIKSFFKYLVDDEVRTDNPAALLEGPKLSIIPILACHALGSSLPTIPKSIKPIRPSVNNIKLPACKSA